ncbi:MAG: hypothetical protein JO145_10335 [Acidobacteriaceae bacterium]|nr:hypothetical protein [Acidobacteriaceae bacterium]MBV9764176.1 hypothetical protein [Acidobacteriaceae bacterium]
MLVSFLGMRALWAGNESFVGKWKLNPSKSQITDEMKVEPLGANKYALTFSGTDPETVVADGTDQPAVFGTTLAVTVDDPNTWRVVRKKDGRMLILGIWKLSRDGNMLRDTFTGYDAKGSASTTDYLYKRTAGTTGFVGTWENTTQETSSVFELHIELWQGDGLSFITSAEATTRQMKFDGADYPSTGPNLAPGSASSGRRVNERTLEVTDKIRGKIIDTQQLDLSPDLKTLTVTVHLLGKSKPNTLVFERE